MKQSRPTIFEVIVKDGNLLNKTNKDGGENLNVFEKLTRACFSQIALETILLPILTITA